ncbi:hypothetical protein ACH79_41620 [Bradyrhizobium sp. CCBAU 051011]|jgi:Protein of unknown function (DUF3551)|uniref:DUF3551 domain-containing protein n=1 Tax=Bradyrhizobium sp. CCBAU 051011 TaxID=858422 RepID=UPI001373EF07|nr:DUF3551 domain-containing protein [Bradyrhizobium sp. CCBAU 051011]QHO78118.1 hypothetical protein ACH79_41620 [Bradyrhizobium sp. CCBAU 051011]
MRILFVAFVTSAIVFLAGINAASAKDYRYCIQGDDFAGGTGECIYSTNAQCQAAASGRTASCTENGNFGASAELIDKNRLRRRPR